MKAGSASNLTSLASARCAPGEEEVRKRNQEAGQVTYLLLDAGGWARCVLPLTRA